MNVVVWGGELSNVYERQALSVCGWEIRRKGEIKKVRKRKAAKEKKKMPNAPV
jgi:hypothetical protein